jgi:phage shock protein C
MSGVRFLQILPAGLVRDMDNAKVAGVCAGLGGYFGVRTKFVRLLFILASVFGFFFFTVTVYVLLALLMPQAPGGFAYGSFDAQGEPNPLGSNSNLRDHFAKLDRRLASMEAWVTSDDYRLRQKFRDL